LPFTTTPAFPSHGTPSSTADMTGGPGFVGLAELQRFVDEGGMLITLRNSTRLAAETGIARELTLAPTGTLFHPGSVVRAKVRRRDHPLMYGYPEVTHVFRGNGPLFDVNARDRNMLVLQYGTELTADERNEQRPVSGFGLDPVPATADSTPSAPTRSQPYVLSGMVRNQDQIIGEGAVFDVPVGRGRVVAFTFNPLHRFLNHHEFAMVWNALMHWNDLPPGPAASRAAHAAGRQ
jgi:hypothetical protein